MGRVKAGVFFLALLALVAQVRGNCDHKAKKVADDCKHDLRAFNRNASFTLSSKCCAAASQVWTASFSKSCACQPSVMRLAAGLRADELAALSSAVAEQCSDSGAADLVVDLPECLLKAAVGTGSASCNDTLLSAFGWLEADLAFEDDAAQQAGSNSTAPLVMDAEPSVSELRLAAALLAPASAPRNASGAGASACPKQALRAFEFLRAGIDAALRNASGLDAQATLLVTVEGTRDEFVAAAEALIDAAGDMPFSVSSGGGSELDSARVGSVPNVCTGYAAASTILVCEGDPMFDSFKAGTCPPYAGFCPGLDPEDPQANVDNQDTYKHRDRRASECSGTPRLVTRDGKACYACYFPGLVVFTTSGADKVLSCEEQGCFPGHATVEVERRQQQGARSAGAGRRVDVVPMRSLRVGDRVRVARADGSTAFEPVVFWDHALPGVAATYVRIELEAAAAVSGDDASSPSSHAGSSVALELTRDHFLPVAAAAAGTAGSGSGGALLGGAKMMRAGDVRPGMTLLVAESELAGAAAAGKGQQLRPAVVRRVALVSREGLFAPVTPSGNVVVDGVVASCHSGWVLDPLFDYLGIPHLLPAAYQAIHWPARAAYSVLGPRIMDVLSRLVAGVLSMDARQVAVALDGMREELSMISARFA